MSWLGSEVRGAKGAIGLTKNTCSGVFVFHPKDASQGKWPVLNIPAAAGELRGLGNLGEETFCSWKNK